MALPSTGYDSQSVTNPDGALTAFTLIVDLSGMSASWWSAVDTSDGTKGRAAKSDETELATDWIDFDDTGETGFLRVIWSGTLAASGTQTLRVYPPVSGNASVAAGDTYGSDNAYDANWLAYYADGAGAVDRTGNGNTLIPVSAGNPTAGDATGQLGEATAYDGITDYMWDETFAAPSAYPITMMAWCEFNDVSGSADDTVALFNDGSTNNYLWLSQDGGVIETRMKSGGGTTYTSTVGSVSANTWTHCATVLTSSALTAYADGVPDASPASHSETIPTLDRVFVGNFPNIAALMAGTIDDVQLHTTNRTDDWIAEEFAQTDDNATFWGTWAWTAPAGSGIVILRRRREAA